MIVNGVKAELSGSMFAASITTRFGVNIVDIVATDDHDAQSTRTCSFLVANKWIEESALKDDTLDLKLTPTAIDDTSRNGNVNSLADILYRIASGSGLTNAVDSALKGTNPLKATGCDSQTCTVSGCVCWYSSAIEYTGLSLPGPTVSLTPVSGGLQAYAHLPNVALNLHVHGDVGPIPYDSTGWVTYSFVDVNDDPRRDALWRQAARDNPAGHGDDDGRDGRDELQRCRCLIINNIVTPLAQGSLQSALTALVTNYLSNNFSSAINGVVSGLEISTPGASFDVPRLDGTGSIPLSFSAGCSSLSLTASELLLGMSSRLTAVPSQSLPSLGVAIAAGTVRDDPAVTAPSAAAAAVHVGVYNQALHALWRGGWFETTLSGVVLGNGLPAEASAEITTSLPSDDVKRQLRRDLARRHAARGYLSGAVRRG